MWRSYFAIRGIGQEPTTPANVKTYDICDRIFTDRFVKADQDILRMYFTSRWGDDLYAVEDFANKKGIPTKVIWMVVRRANRLVIEEIGILDRKEGDE